MMDWQGVKGKETSSTTTPPATISPGLSLFPFTPFFSGSAGIMQILVSYHKHCTNPSVYLPLHFPLTCQKDPEVLELLHLGQDLLSNLEKALHILPAENHDLKFTGADFHPLHTRLQSDAGRAGGYGLTGPTGPHHLLKTDT